MANKPQSIVDFGSYSATNRCFCLDMIYDINFWCVKDNLLMLYGKVYNRVEFVNI